MTGLFFLYGQPIQLYGEQLALYATPPPTPQGGGGWLRRRRR